MKIQELEAKSIIVPSNLPDVDYVINPYTGCQFGCIYCYATFMGRFVNEPRSNWGNYVYVKVNAVELAGDQLRRWGAKRKQSSILFSSVTDPYHGVEHKYRRTRGVLEVLVELGYPGPVSILTKSPLVSRDVDLLRRLNADVGLTITTTDDKLSRYLEVSAPLASRRLDTLEKLAQAGIRTYVFVGPLLPHFRYQPELLDDLFGAIAKTGTQEVYVEHINLPSYVKNKMWSVLKDESEEIQAVYKQAQTQEHREILNALVEELTRKHDLRIRFGGTIYHPDLK
jgi:DNA repair photolyase